MKKTISLVLVLALGLATEVAKADFTFGTPTNLGPTVNSPSFNGLPSISADGLSLFFTSNRPGGSGGDDLWVTTRATKDDPWGEPVNLGSTVNTSQLDVCPAISANGLSLFFGSERAGGSGGRDLWVTTRATKYDPWGEPVNLGATVNSSAFDCCPSVSADGMSIYFTSPRSGGYGSYDLYVTTRATTSDPWGPAVNLGPTVNSSASEMCMAISADGLALFFISNRAGGSGDMDIWVSTRETKDNPWSTPVNLGPTVNSSSTDRAPTIPANGLTLYFESLRPEGSGIWQVSIIPIVDLNGDGIVDSADMCIMVDHWGTDEPLCDIGPMPWGDGIVDVQDLIVLAEHLFKEVDDPTLVAHWALDEAEGNIAYDGANGNNGSVHGDPAWQPEGGMVDGALQLDGIDDYVNTPFVLNPADGKFSVFVWIKGGAPGQVVISQAGNPAGVNWLCVDPSDGKLMTRLSRPPGGRVAPQPLVSESTITDGEWHRVGFVWDGSQRLLYVDDIEVAGDTQTGLAGSTGGLYFGAGSTLDAANFWSGLIDDVRIYNRVVIPMESRDTSREVHVDENDAGSQVELEQGQILVVTLESNPTTGYRWEQAENQESILQQMGEAEFKPSETGEPPLVGAGGWEIFRFKAISAGQMTLQLVYHRSWEEGVEPLKTFSLQVVVR